MGPPVVGVARRDSCMMPPEVPRRPAIGVRERRGCAVGAPEGDVAVRWAPDAVLAVAANA
ncbi:hypothetical protein [Actinotalea caeni]|uniref:hypothetical protein n=1 Tax=Actinotalea caeni TaxID=1348467 RepID=UPI0012E2A9E1|nr:hypothetical protein [Actinotalea caeni]